MNQPLTAEETLEVWKRVQISKHAMLILFCGLIALFFFPVGAQHNVWIPFAAFFLAKVIYTQPKVLGQLIWDSCFFCFSVYVFFM